MAAVWLLLLLLLPPGSGAAPMAAEGRGDGGAAGKGPALGPLGAQSIGAGAGACAGKGRCGRSRAQGRRLEAARGRPGLCEAAEEEEEEIEEEMEEEAEAGSAGPGPALRQ